MRTRKTKSLNEDDSVCVVNYATRTLYIYGEINRSSAVKVNRAFKRLKKISNEPVLIEIDSDGGDMEAGMLIINSMGLSGLKTTTRVVGSAYSMAAIVLVAGDVRQAYPDARIMFHEGRYRMNGKFSDLVTEFEENKRIENLTWDVVDRKTSKPAGYWANLVGSKDYYMSAQTALELSVLDEIVGEL